TGTSSPSFARRAHRRATACRRRVRNPGRRAAGSRDPPAGRAATRARTPARPPSGPKTSMDCYPPRRPYTRGGSHAPQSSALVNSLRSMSAPELLMQLLSAPGPSRHESAPAPVWREYCARFAEEVGGDRIGSSFARVPRTADDPRMIVVGHIDEIGLHISHID